MLMQFERGRTLTQLPAQDWYSERVIKRLGEFNHHVSEAQRLDAEAVAAETELKQVREVPLEIKVAQKLSKTASEGKYKSIVEELAARTAVREILEWLKIEVVPVAKARRSEYRRLREIACKRLTAAGLLPGVAEALAEGCDEVTKAFQKMGECGIKIAVIRLADDHPFAQTQKETVRLGAQLK